MSEQHDLMCVAENLAVYESFKGHRDQHFGFKTFAQNGEDLMIVNLFRQLGIERPTYLDVGCHHPWNISNTALLYCRGSQGVCVDANPNFLDLYEKDRPRDRFLNFGVTVDAGFEAFYMFDGYSGRNTFSYEEAQRFSEESGIMVQRTRDIPTRTLNQIVDGFCDGQFPNFLNLDVEAMEFHVLNQTDFSKSSPEIICVESRRYQSQQMFFMMRKDKRYVPYCRMGENVIFIRQSEMPQLHC